MTQADALQGCFVAGTDTEIGKTRISAALLHWLAHSGWRAGSLGGFDVSVVAASTGVVCARVSPAVVGGGLGGSPFGIGAGAPGSLSEQASRNARPVPTQAGTPVERRCCTAQV